MIFPAAAPPAGSAPTGPTLRDIHLPPSPSWWPPAPGWWIVASVLLLAVLAMFFFWRLARHRRAARARLLGEVDALAVRYGRDGRSESLATGLHQLLRRGARSLDLQATRQHGEAWRATLARVPVGAATIDILVSLEQAMYRPVSSFQAEPAIQATRDWLASLHRAKRLSPEAANPALPAPTAVAERDHA